MLLFIDESGHDRSGTPCEVLAGVTVAEDSLLARMRQPVRQEILPFATKVHGMQFHGEKPKPTGEGSWPLHGIVYLDDLRGQANREQGDE